MTSKAYLFAGVFLLSVLALAAFPGVRDELHWQWSSFHDRTDNYESYLAFWPSGRHFGEARVLADERLWTAVRNADIATEYERYLRSHPDGRYAVEARQGVEDLHWQQAISENSFASFDGYLNTYPAGRFSREASTRQAEILADDSVFLAAQAQGTRTALEIFLTEFPGHDREAKARSALEDMAGRDIVDLVREKKIEFKSRGSGISSVRVSMRRLVNYPVIVRIPVGTFFVSNNRASQNMVTTSQETRTLTADRWFSFSLPAACAKRPRRIPDSTDNFAVERSPRQAELAKLMAAIGDLDVEFPVIQAAVWIVTDNASYSDLGILVNRSVYQAYGGTRVIQENHVASAMKIGSDAGIDIKEKAIWKDRKLIATELPAGELRRWLADGARYGEPVAATEPRAAPRRVIDPDATPEERYQTDKTQLEAKGKVVYRVSTREITEAVHDAFIISRNQAGQLVRITQDSWEATPIGEDDRSIRTDDVVMNISRDDIRRGDSHIDAIQLDLMMRFAHSLNIEPRNLVWLHPAEDPVPPVPEGEEYSLAEHYGKQLDSATKEE